MSASDQIASFRAELATTETAELVQRRITSGACFALTDKAYFDLKKVVAEQFKLHVSSVVVVGSAKLGFSIAPLKRYRPFGDTSDIDIALCSGELYDEFWGDVFDYWARGESWPELGDFRKYHFRGWMRPDKLPPSSSFSRAQDWWDFFRRLTSSSHFGPYKISAALYKSWTFLEAYQQRCVGDCRSEEVRSK